MKRLLIIAALLMLAAPAHADTVVINTTAGPWGNVWYQYDLFGTFYEPCCNALADSGVQLYEYEATFPAGTTFQFTNTPYEGLPLPAWAFYYTGISAPPPWIDPDPWDNVTQWNSVAAAAAVPEPSTWAMMLLGFAGLGFAFRQSQSIVGQSNKRI